MSHPTSRPKKGLLEPSPPPIAPFAGSLRRGSNKPLNGLGLDSRIRGNDGILQRFASPISGRLCALLFPILLGIVGWPAQSHAQSPGVEPQAVAILKRMTDYLAGLKQFSVETRSSIDAVLTSGQKLQFDNGATATVQRPNKLYARRKGDLLNQAFYYDGKSLSLINPDDRYYATVAAPGTLEEMLDFAKAKLGVFIPAGDLLYKNAFELLTQDVKAGFIVGKGIVDGVRCDHLAFRGPEVDWQIWIEEGAKPLPRKYLITSTQDPGSPQFTILMSDWNTAPQLTDFAFAFTPPQGARKIDFLELTAGGASKR